MFGPYALTFGRGEHRHALLQRARALGLAICDHPAWLFVAAPETNVLSDQRTLLVGQIFSGGGEPLADVPRLDGTSVPDLARALQGLWGNFVLFRAEADERIAYRDPSASVSVYRLGKGSGAVFVSDAAIAAKLGLLGAARIDLRFAVHWLQFPFLRNPRTGIEQVTELLPGTAATQSGTGRWTETALWRPAEFVRRSDAILDLGDAAGRLRELAPGVVQAQAGTRPILLQLSGGLDSSILAACLSHAGRTVLCVNFATRGRDGDERSYARDVAAAFALPLAELRETGPRAIEPDPEPRFRPGVNPLLAPFEQAVAGAASEHGASLLVDGAGGDNLFCSITTASPVLDALAWGGIGAARHAAGDIALRAGCTWWEVLAAVGRRLATRRARWKEDRTFLDAAALLQRAELHPWLEGLGAAPPGKYEHVEALVHIQHFLDRGSTGLPRLHPLMAQPLLELCLRIPSWLWMRGGRDRAVARHAFAGLVPRSVLERRAKGSLQSLFHRSFATLRGQMLDLLMSGGLRSAGILDSGALEAALGGEDWMREEVQLRVSELVALELWLQSWRACRQRALSRSHRSYCAALAGSGSR
jgi:asparagine synthase (glutamine-hydrolysing)